MFILVCYIANTERLRKSYFEELRGEHKKKRKNETVATKTSKSEWLNWRG